jgi:putative ABC transport system permease protein
VVGVVEDTKVKTLGQGPEAMIYVPLAQRHRGSVILMARGSGDPTALARRLRTTAKELDPDLYVHSVMSAEESMSTALFLPRMAGMVLGIFGGLALFMSAIGLYAIVSYTVASREREMGIRLALGARADEMVRLMMGQGLRVVGIGLVLGTGLAVLAGTTLERFLFGVSGTDPLTLVTVPVVLLAVAVLAAWAPARRATRVDPMETLRAE